MAASSSSDGRWVTDGRGAGTSGSAGEENQARLEEGQVVVAATDIAYGRGEQTGEQRGAEIGTGSDKGLTILLRRRR